MNRIGFSSFLSFLCFTFWLAYIPLLLFEISSSAFLPEHRSTLQTCISLIHSVHSDLPLNVTFSGLSTAPHLVS
ncbi:hypothetical protein CW304_23675 [Bacillus sp. UFRGS-B20]|nr:hypothetical protein CW304_23675 [Bacillus sp. UFRGS-B20]